MGTEISFNPGIHDGGLDKGTVNRPEGLCVWVRVYVCLKSPPHRFVIYLFPIPIEILSSSLVRPAHSDEFVRPVLSLHFMLCLQYHTIEYNTIQYDSSNVNKNYE